MTDRQAQGEHTRVGDRQLLSINGIKSPKQIELAVVVGCRIAKHRHLNIHPFTLEVPIVTNPSGVTSSTLKLLSVQSRKCRATSSQYLPVPFASSVAGHRRCKLLVWRPIQNRSMCGQRSSCNPSARQSTQN